MGLKDKYKNAPNAPQQALIFNALESHQAEISNLKTSFLQDNFLLLSVVQILIEKGFLREEELHKKKEDVITAYYSSVEANYNQEFDVELVDRKSAKGDHLSISFAGFVDGKKVPDLSSPWFFVVLGNNTLLFEKDLYNRTPGEEFEASVRMPKDHFKEELRDKIIKFQVTIRNVKEEKAIEEGA